jgi:hypothetical protein
MAYRPQTLVNVRFGSKADARTAKSNVRFTPESGHSLAQVKCLLRARNANAPRRHLSSGSVKCVCVFEQPHVLSHVVATFLQGLWIPFAAVGSEKSPP